MSWCTSFTLFALILVLVRAEDHYHNVKPTAIRSVKSTAFRAREGEKTPDFWYKDAHDAISAKQLRGLGADTARAKNVIMFLGDGMSVPTLTAARTLLGQRRQESGEEAKLSFEEFPDVGLSKTYCVDAQIPDSACTATAYLCGVKNNYGTIGLTADVVRGDCPTSMDNATHIYSIASWALQDGRDAGIVTTTRVTHASPSGAYARVANRNWENDAEVNNEGYDPEQCRDIAYQLIHSYPGNEFKVILGGGRREFIPISVIDEEGGNGKRVDGRNLIQEWRQTKEQQEVTHKYVWNKTDLLQTMESPPEYLLGLFENDHMLYHLEADPESEPTLADLTEAAIKMLSRNENGFFLFVEGGRIDHAHHENHVHLALDETIELSLAVERAMELLPEDETLLVVTADHAHVMAFSGYTSRGGDVLGVSDSIDSDGVPYMTLSYANGPGFRPHVDNKRPDVTTDADINSIWWRSHVDAPLESETHGGDDVAVFAKGPHSNMFAGMYEQSQIPHFMAYAGCFGPGPHACSAAHVVPISFSLIILTLAFCFS